MIILDREKKELIIPSGIGNLDQEYKQGFEDGKAYQESADQTKLTFTAITENGTYNAEYGFYGVEVNVPDKFDEGFTSGETAQKAKLISTAVTHNGTYSREDGFDSIEVNVPTSGGSGQYEQGYADGEAAQKAKLVSTAVTENGTYSREDGFNSIVVNVPTSGGGCRLQDKVFIPTTKYMENIYPDEGYDGMSHILLLNSNLYQSAYTEGYAAGQADCPECSGGSCTLQQKAYTIPTTAATAITITPDSGYDGMSVVNIDASAINDAYTDGYIYGRQYQKGQLTSTAITENGRYTREDGFSTIVVNVPQSGASYQQGYDDGYVSGFTAGHYTSGSPWFGFSFYVSGTPQVFTGNPMNLYIKVKGAGGGDYGFADIVDAHAGQPQAAFLANTNFFALIFNVHGMTYFDTPYEFEVYIPKSEITNWPNIFSQVINSSYIRLNGTKYQYNKGCPLIVESANITEAAPVVGGPECKKLYYKFKI